MVRESEGMLMLAHEFVLPTKAENTHWEDREHDFIDQCLREGLTAQRMHELHPSRNIRAFEAQARKLGFGKREEEDGMIRFYPEIKRRGKRILLDQKTIDELYNNDVDSDEAETVEVSNSTKVEEDVEEETLSESTSLISNLDKPYTEADMELDIKIATAQATLNALLKLKESRC